MGSSQPYIILISNLDQTTLKYIWLYYNKWIFPASVQKSLDYSFSKYVLVTLSSHKQ